VENFVKYVPKFAEECDAEDVMDESTNVMINLALISVSKNGKLEELIEKTETSLSDISQIVYKGYSHRPFNLQAGCYTRELLKAVKLMREEVIR